MLPGVRPSICLASSPTARTCLRAPDVGDRHHRRLVEDDAAALDVHEGVGGPEIDRHVGGKQTQHLPNHCGHKTNVDDGALPFRRAACPPLNPAADQ